ncbi:MAG: hypothetical protein AABW58_00640 [Nanoarchaeota archaeon]
MKRSLILFLVLIILVISGCTQIPNLPSPGNLPGLGQKEKTITESKGLTIKFLENQPPLDEIIAGQNFKISIELTNNDPEQVTGTIKLSDTPSDEFSSLQGKEESSFSLSPAEVLQEGAERISKSIPSQEILHFGPYTYGESKAFKGMTTNFITEIITNHRATATAQFCVKSSDSQESKCQNKETITSFGPRGNLGPVKITKIEKTLIPDEGLVTANLKITIKNSGRGKIDNEDQILNSFNIRMLGDSSLTCSKTERLSLKEGERTVTCTVDIGISEELFRQEVLEISYDYPYKIIETLGPIKVIKIEI